MINDKQSVLVLLVPVMCAECVQIVDKGAGLRGADAPGAGLLWMVRWDA